METDPLRSLKRSLKSFWDSNKSNGRHPQARVAVESYCCLIIVSLRRNVVIYSLFTIDSASVGYCVNTDGLYLSEQYIVCSI